MIAYCGKCGKKVSLLNVQEIKTKHGIKEYKGKCPFCGSIIYVRTKEQ